MAPPRAQAGVWRATPLSSSVGKAIKTTGADFPSPPGKTVVRSDDAREQTVRLGSKNVGLVWKRQLLALRDARTNKSVTLVGRDDAGFVRMAADFQAEHQGLNAEQAKSTRGWSSHKQLEGYGTAGQLVSVAEKSRLDLGGTQANTSERLRTFDSRTGQSVQLDTLLTGDQFGALVDVIENRLAHSTKLGADVPALSREELESTISQSFAVSTGKSGNVSLHVAWANDQSPVQFSFAAPESAVFKKAIG